MSLIDNINQNNHFKDIDVYTYEYINYISLSVFDDYFNMFVNMFVDDKA